MFLLNAQEGLKWLKNQKNFLKPLALVVAGFYFPPLFITLSTAGHVVSLADFVPSAAVITAFFLYLANAAYDFLLKWGKTQTE